MLQTKITKYLLLVLLSTIESLGHTQSINFKTNHYSIKDGLPGREIYDAIQDPQGFIWISSYKHLSRFDGYTFTDISKLIKQGSATQKIELNSEQTTLESVSQDQFMIKYTSENPIFEIVNTNNIDIKTYDLTELFKGKKIIDFISCSVSGFISVITLEQSDLLIYTFDPKTNKIEQKIKFSLDEYQFNDRLTNIQVTNVKSQNRLYFSAAKMPVILFDLQERTATYLPINISNTGYKKIKSIKENELALIDTDLKRVLIYNHQDQKTRIILEPLQSQRIDEIWTDEDGNIILANIENRVYQDLCFISYTNRNVISLNTLLKTENLISQFRGDHFLDQILLSTFTGFHILTNERKRFKPLLSTHVKNGNFGHIIRSMIEDGNGSLYINEEKNKIYKLNLNTDSIEKIFKNSPYPDVAINGSMKKIDNYLWGVCAKTPKKDQLYSFNLSTEKFKYWNLPFDNFALKAMAVVDSNQLICFGRDFKKDTPAVHQFNTITGVWKNFNPDTSVTQIKYQFVLNDKSQWIWIGTSTGLFQLNVVSKKMEKIAFGTTENPQLDISIHTLAKHPITNHLLIGTEYGVWIYDPIQKKHIDHFTKESISLCNDNIEGILLKNDNEFFVTTDNGLSLVNLKTRQARNYFENDGLASNEFNVLATHKGSNGHYYFGGLNGVTIVTDSSLNEYNSKKSAISRFYKFDPKSGIENRMPDNIEINKSFIIEPDVQYFGFDLMYPDYSEPRLNQFQTWLEGYENDWQQPSTNNKIRYGRLPKGNYTFHFRGFPNINNELKVGVQVKEHFYRSPWFGSGMAILILGGGLGLFVRYQNRKRNEELEKQKTNQKFKDLETAALRAQMNPHFIFNCLGSIQQFINEHDTDSASKYLANFARLVRLALHSSVDGKHSLQDEIDMLDNYLGLERLRFGESFSYDIQVDLALDKEDIYIPPLLIQPFVENALLHGMKNKVEGGKINVTFNHDENGINASVTDNGPGILTEKRSMDSSGHKSIGMTLTKKRLEILSSNEAFKVSSYLDDDGNVAGTRVSIVIPIL